MNQLVASQKKAVQLAVNDMKRAVGRLSYLPADLQYDMLVDIVSGLVSTYGDVAATAAAEWYRQARIDETGEDFDALTFGSFNPDKAFGSPDVQKQFVTLDAANMQQVQAFLEGAMQRWITYYGRETVARNIRRDPKKPRWARVPSGAKTCAFCELLASRGFVYHSKETAGALKSWHSHCDCMIVPSWEKNSAHIAGYDPDTYYKRYKQAYALAQAEKDVSINNVARHMRKLFPNQYTDNTSTKKKRSAHDSMPRKKRSAWEKEKDFVGMKGVASADSSVWDKRQKAIGIPADVDVLEMHEIVFMEKFKALGQHFEWIPKDEKGRTPTTDFLWIEKSSQIELKGVRRIRYSSIAGQISKAVSKAANNKYKSTIKDSFLIDLGENKVPEKLIRQLERYNINNPEATIKKLWVYSCGEIIQILLKEEK